MQSGYKIIWTDNALSELQETISYLEEHFSAQEIKNLAVGIEHTLSLISVNPELFPATGKKKKLHRAVVKKYNTLYYKVEKKEIILISFFSNRQNPDKRNL